MELPTWSSHHETLGGLASLEEEEDIEWLVVTRAQFFIQRRVQYQENRSHLLPHQS